MALESLNLKTIIDALNKLKENNKQEFNKIIDILQGNGHLIKHCTNEYNSRHEKIDIISAKLYKFILKFPRDGEIVSFTNEELEIISNAVNYQYKYFDEQEEIFKNLLLSEKNMNILSSKLNIKREELKTSILEFEKIVS